MATVRAKHSTNGETLNPNPHELNRRNENCRNVDLVHRRCIQNQEEHFFGWCRWPLRRAEREVEMRWGWISCRKGKKTHFALFFLSSQFSFIFFYCFIVGSGVLFFVSPFSRIWTFLCRYCGRVHVTDSNGDIRACAVYNFAIFAKREKRKICIRRHAEKHFKCINIHFFMAMQSFRVYPSSLSLSPSPSSSTNTQRVESRCCVIVSCPQWPIAFMLCGGFALPF